MADAYQSLDSLRTLLRVRRQQHMERMAGGLEGEERYQEYVGRCKELKDTIDRIGEQIKSLNRGDDDGE